MSDDYETYADTPSEMRPGYRPLSEGEMIQVGDIYWSNGKWYRVASTMKLQPLPKEWVGLYGRREA